MLNKINKFKDIWNRFVGKGIYPHELSFLLDTQLRKLILSPKQLSNYLHLQENSIVLEIGSGPGYFSVEVAKRIPNGFIIIFDIQKEMLLRAGKKIKNKNLNNGFLLQGNAERLPFLQRQFNIVFLVTVLGEIIDIENCIKSIYEILDFGGILSITEMKGDPDFLSFDKINNLVTNYNFKLLDKFESKNGITINFKKV